MRFFISLSESVAFHTEICGALVCPPYSKCQSAGICVCKNCSHDGKKVCASDGKTYNDSCKLQKVACESNSTLKIARKGPCQGRFQLLPFVSLHHCAFQNATMAESSNLRLSLHTSPSGPSGRSLSRFP